MTDINTDDLYGLPLERFVPERAALARATRAEGRREEAAAVARLPKPSVAAWVVNQLVRGHRDAIKALLDAGDALRDAQAAVIEGRGDGQSLRAAAERERTAVDGLLGAARALASEGGPSLSATIIDRVADTLHATAFDERAREQVRDGRLERELRHVGLGTLGAGPVTPAKRQPAAQRGAAAGKAAKQAAGKAAKQAAAKAPKQDGAKAARQAEAEARKADKQAEADAREASRAARQAEAQARRRAERAARALTRAEERQEQAAQALSDADEALGAARSESEAADEAHAAARSEAESATEAHRRAAG